MRIPTTGIAGCCARAANGAVTSALPRSDMSSRRFHRPPGQFRPPGLRRLRRNHPAGTGRPFRRPAGDIFLGFSRRRSRRAVELGRAAAERSLRRSHKARHTEWPAWAYGAAHAQPTPLSDIATFRATSRSREIERLHASQSGRLSSKAFLNRSRASAKAGGGGGMAGRSGSAVLRD